MYNWADICSELKELEKRVDTKMNRIISLSANPFPYDRLKKGKEIMALSMALRMFIRPGSGKGCYGGTLYAPRKRRKIKVGEVK